MPVFFVVLAATLLTGAFLFPPDDFTLLGQSALASVFFAANLYFSRGQGYFDPAQDEKPLLHIWSLSVEEQYYFLFPVLLLLLIKRDWRFQIGMMLAISLLSLIASLLPHALLDKYYLPHLRAFEMMTGSITAVILQAQVSYDKHWGKQFAAIGSLLSLIVLLVCLFLYHPQMPHIPGWAGLLPCVATAAFIYFNRFDHAVKKWFTWKWTVGIGLISYSLYLWHWPVLAFARYITGTHILPHSWLLPLLALIVALSILTYFGVEKPMKHWRKTFASSALWIYALPATLLAITWISLQHSPLMSRFHQQNLTRTHTSCHNALNKQCVWGDENVQPKILMSGDSHADQYKTFMDYLGKREGWSATLISADTCAYVENYDSLVWQQNRTCRDMYGFVEQHGAEYPIFILAMRWGNQIPTDKRSISYDPNFFNKFEKMLSDLAQSKQAIYLFTDNPNTQYPGLRAYKLEQILSITPVKLHTKDDTYEQGNQKIAAIASRFPNVHIIDTLEALPADFRINGKPVYFDFDHINPFGAEMMAQKFSQTQKLLHSAQH